MFQSAEIGHQLTKAAYRAAVPTLRAELLAAQIELFEQHKTPVLVERVDGFCAEADWLRGYSEINDFEHELIEAGVIVVKFWLQISQAEQLKRFKEREQVTFKRFKTTQEDWRNREKWHDCQQAICDMVERTSTGEVPWDGHQPDALFDAK